MNLPKKMKPGAEMALLVLLLAAGAASAIFFQRQTAAAERQLASSHWKHPVLKKPAEAIDFQSLEKAVAGSDETVLPSNAETRLFVGELRVAAIGSAYPIPYEAETCPYSGIPQPALNQLDRDGDGITDDWEIKFGLDKYQATDAGMDSDGDGFSNLEEFRSHTDPRSAASAPPYATKLRFLEQKEKDFPLVFQGVTELPDGSFVFQINTPEDGKSHFLSVGDKLQGAVIQEFNPGSGGELPRLYLMRGETRIELVRGEITADPESEAELINLLDHTTKIATMGALLSLYDDEYAVLGVYKNKVVLKHIQTGDVFEIVSLAEGESKDSPEDL